MASLITQGNASGTGSVTLATPATNSNRTQTLPDEDGTVYTSGSPVRTQKGVPAFSAYKSATTQTLANATFTKIVLDAENFDTTGAFDNTTNYRFQPNVAGYYSLHGTAAIAATSPTRVICSAFKNGTEVIRGNDSQPVASLAGGLSVFSGIVYLNGSTDYVELFAFGAGSTSPIVQNGVGQTQFSGILIAAA